MLISILFLIVAMALPSLKHGLSSIFFLRITAIILIFAGVLSYNAMYIQSIGSGTGLYSGLIHVTFISQVMDTFVLILASLILIAWPLMKTNNFYLFGIMKEYCIIILFSALGSLLLISSSDLISMYLSIELQSFGVYILATLNRKSLLATSAGLKYFLLGALSSCFILLGSGLVYTFTGLTNLESIYSLLSVIQLSEYVNEINNINNGVNLGLIFIFLGLLFKIAAAPLHNWSFGLYFL